MQIAYKWTKCEPTKEIIDQVDRQVGALARLAGDGARAAVELELAVGGKQKGDVWRAEVSVFGLRGAYRAESTKAKLSHAVTTAARDVKQELQRAKRKDQHQYREGGGAIKAFLRGFGK